MGHSALLAGPVAGLVFASGVAWLGSTRPGYSAVRQTVSELGPVGDRGRLALAAINVTIALCSLIFAYGLLSVAREFGTTTAPAYFVGSFALLAAALAAFPSPHPLHNIVGLLQTLPFVGAPLTVALGWRQQGPVIPLSWVALLLLVLAMILNIAPAFSARITRAVAPAYGLIQRSIFVAWYGWCAALGLLLFVRGA